MSTVKTKNVQVGTDGTASNNFTIYVPGTPDGTVRIGNGDAGAVTDAVTINSSGAVTLANNLSVTGTSTLTGNVSVNGANISTQPSFRNRIINGDMLVNQRGGTITVNNASDNYGIDRWQGRGTASDGIFTTVQDTESPTGFTNSAKITVTTADTSIGTSERYEYRHRIEGYNIADLAWGSSNAKTVTLSFWVRSSVTGTFGGSFTNSAGNRSYVFSYTITSANTWEQKTITVAGDTSGTWLTNNGIGINLSFSLGHGSDYVQNAGSWYASYEAAVTGQTNLIATNAATWYLTGVQLEVGSGASGFEFLPYDVELARCQRYYYKTNTTTGSDRYAFFYPARVTTATQATVCATYPTMRTSPSITQSGTGINIGPQGATTAFTGSWVTPSSAWIDVTVSGVSMTAGQCVMLNANNNTNAYVAMDAEL